MRRIALLLALLAAAAARAGDYAGPLFDGSDTWINQRWQYDDELMKGYRSWLGEPPPAAARRIAWDNGAALFGLPAP